MLASTDLQSQLAPAIGRCHPSREITISSKGNRTSIGSPLETHAGEWPSIHPRPTGAVTGRVAATHAESRRARPSGPVHRLQEPRRIFFVRRATHFWWGRFCLHVQKWCGAPSSRVAADANVNADHGPGQSDEETLQYTRPLTARLLDQAHTRRNVILDRDGLLRAQLSSALRPFKVLLTSSLTEQNVVATF